MEGFYLMPHPPVIMPEVGKGQERKIQKTIDACKKVAEDISELDADVIILVTPHGHLFRDAIALVEDHEIHGTMAQFGAQQLEMRIKIDTELTNQIVSKATEIGIQTAPLNKKVGEMYGFNLQLDHGAIVPLSFLKDLEKYKFVHITYGFLSPIELYKFGVAIQEVINVTNKKAVFIASGDLSHRLLESGPYEFSEHGQAFDKQILEIFKSGELQDVFTLNTEMVSEAGECALRSIYVLCGAMDGLEVIGQVLSYEGTFGVGYAVVSFDVKAGVSKVNMVEESFQSTHLHRLKNGSLYTQLARMTLEKFLKTGITLELPDNMPSEITSSQKGVFVSLKKWGELRGCIGTIHPTTASVGKEIIRNAIAAASDDPRFPPVEEEELFEIDISVDILHEPEEATIDQLDVETYGVIVTNGRRRGLLLPNLEGVTNVAMQLSIALDKAGIKSNENFQIERFKVDRYNEE